MRWIYGRYVITSSLTGVLHNNNNGISRKVHFNMVNLFIDSLGFHCASRSVEINTRYQHETNTIHDSSIGTITSNLNMIHIIELFMTEDSRFNQIVQNCCFIMYTDCTFLIWSDMEFNSFVPCIFVMSFRTSILPWKTWRSSDWRVSWSWNHYLHEMNLKTFQELPCLYTDTKIFRQIFVNVTYW